MSAVSMYVNVFFYMVANFACACGTQSVRVRIVTGAHQSNKFRYITKDKERVGQAKHFPENNKISDYRVRSTILWMHVNQPKPNEPMSPTKTPMAPNKKIDQRRFLGKKDESKARVR